jgi:hypothetical protein
VTSQELSDLVEVQGRYGRVSSTVEAQEGHNR